MKKGVKKINDKVMRNFKQFQTLANLKDPIATYKILLKYFLNVTNYNNYNNPKYEQYLEHNYSDEA